MMKIFIELLIKTLLETFYLTGMFILIGLFLGVLRNSSLKNFQRSFGNKSIMITGFIGVPIHELSHAIFALIFGHKITEIKLFQKPDISGVMGYVKHSYSKNSVYQQVGNFFIGVAPILGGILSIVTLMRVIIPEAYSKFIGIIETALKVTILNKITIDGIISSYLELIKDIFSLENFKNPYFYIFIFVAMCISSHISLSNEDIKGASRGLGIIFIILILINSLGLSKYISEVDIIKYNVLITSVLIIAVILSIITFLISILSRVLKR